MRVWVRARLRHLPRVLELLMRCCGGCQLWRALLARSCASLRPAQAELALTGLGGAVLEPAAAAGPAQACTVRHMLQASCVVAGILAWTQMAGKHASAAKL